MRVPLVVKPLRAVYLYDKLLRDFSLLTMDSMPSQAAEVEGNSMQLRNRTVETSPLAKQKGVKRQINEKKDESSAPKRLKPNDSPSMEQMIVNIPQEVAAGNPNNAIVTIEAGQVSPVSETGSVMQDLTNIKAAEEVIKDSLEDSRMYRYPLLKLAGCGREELKLTMIIQRTISSQHVFVKTGLLLGVGLPKLDSLFVQNRYNVQQAAVDMISDLVDRERCIDSMEELYNLLHYCADRCDIVDRFQVNYFIEYDGAPPPLAESRAEMMIERLTVFPETMQDLILLLVAEHCFEKFTTPHGAATQFSAHMGIYSYAKMACAFSCTDGRMLFHRALVTMADWGGIPYTLFRLLQAERRGGSSETDIEKVVESYPMVKIILGETLDDILAEEEHPRIPRLIGLLGNKPPIHTAYIDKTMSSDSTAREE